MIHATKLISIIIILKAYIRWLYLTISIIIILIINLMKIISLYILLKRGSLGWSKHPRFVLISFCDLFTNPSRNLIDFVQYRTTSKKEFSSLVIIHQCLFKPFQSIIGRSQIKVKIGRNEGTFLGSIFFVIFKILLDERLQLFQHITD